MDKETRKREAPISYRPPKHLREEFDRRVSSSGLSAGAFITNAVFSADPPRSSRRPGVNHEAVARLLAELARLRDQLHELEPAARGDAGNALLLEEAVRQLGEIRAACFQALGRKP